MFSSAADNAITLGSAETWQSVLPSTSPVMGPCLLECINHSAYLRFNPRSGKPASSPFGTPTLGNTVPREWEAIRRVSADY